MPATAPAIETSVRSDPRDARTPHLSTYLPPRLDPETAPVVLVAEDHEDSRDALCTLLDALGYRVVTATNGAEAVEVARKHRPDLVLMDMMMPGVDGFQATRTLRADPAFREVPIIAITAMEGARDAVLEAGCSDCVLKPLDIRGFPERLRVWLAARQAG
jgi:CheY-like chemotaxis protein